MITNFKLFEKYKSGIFEAEIEDEILIFSLTVYEKPFKVNIMLDSDKYAELSIRLPDSDKLESGEFFLNPEINEEIVDALLDQGFIIEGDKTALAGDVETKSYIMSI